MQEPNDGNDSPRPRQHTGALIGGAVIGMAVTVGFLLVIRTILLREAVPPLTRADFDAAIERWDAKGPKNYDCDIEISGNRPGIVHVEVRAGEVSRMTRDGESPSQRRTWDVWSVDGMFDTIDRELEIASNPELPLGISTAPFLSARFHPELGYPEVYRRSVQGAQQDLAWKVTRFVSHDKSGSP